MKADAGTKIIEELVQERLARSKTLVIKNWGSYIKSRNFKACNTPKNCLA
jgi:hypothetical protein